MSNRYRHLAKDMGIFAIGNFGTKVLSFLCVSLYTSFLSTSEFGEADVLTTTVSLLLPVLTIAISEAVLRFFYDRDVNENQVVSISVKIVLLASLMSVLIAIVTCQISPKLSKYAPFFVLIFLLNSFESVLSSITKGQGKSKAFAMKGIIYTASFIGSNILFLTVLHWGLKGYLFSYIIAFSISCLYMVFATKLYAYNIFVKTDSGLLHSMLSYSAPYIPATISWWINSSSDKYMLIWLVGSSANGVYSIAQKIPTIITAVTGIFTQAWQLSALQNYEEKDFSDYFSEIFRLLYALLIFGTCAIFIMNKPIALLLFKNDFYIAWKFVPMLTVAAIFSTIAGFLASAFTTTKHTNVLFVSTCIAAAVNIILNYVLILNMGTFGAAVATAISFFVMVVVRVLSMRKFFSIYINYCRVVISVAIVFVTALALPYSGEYYYYIAFGVSALIISVNVKDFILLLKSIIMKLRKG